jgi:uncharacterized coiled-coil DUF342 family protein
MTSTSSPAERIRELTLQLETERENAIVQFISAIKGLALDAQDMHDFEVYPAGIAEEARQLYTHLIDASDRLSRLASAPATKAG